MSTERTSKLISFLRSYKKLVRVNKIKHPYCNFVIMMWVVMKEGEQLRIVLNDSLIDEFNIIL